jgi:hypothetical protein
MSQPPSDFESQAQAKRTGILGEFWDFLKHNKKWWLLPLLVMLLLIGAVIILGGTAVAPFIYTLF